MDYLELTAAELGLVYLYFEYRASAWLWVPSILMPALYLGVFYEAGLYADLAINVYYIVASVYGLACWLRGAKGGADTSTPITRTPRRLAWPLVGAGVAVFVVTGLVLSRLTDSTVPWADAFTTALSVVALWMLARKYVEQWLVWIAADAACAALYAYKGLWPTAVLYLLYTVIAVAGYRKWKAICAGE